MRFRETKGKISKEKATLLKEIFELEHSPKTVETLALIAEKQRLLKQSKGSATGTINIDDEVLIRSYSGEIVSAVGSLSGVSRRVDALYVKIVGYGFWRPYIISTRLTESQLETVFDDSSNNINVQHCEFYGGNFQINDDGNIYPELLNDEEQVFTDLKINPKGFFYGGEGGFFGDDIFHTDPIQILYGQTVVVLNNSGPAGLIRWDLNDNWKTSTVVYVTALTITTLVILAFVAYVMIKNSYLK